MQGQVKLAESLRKDLHEPFGVTFGLTPDDKVSSARELPPHALSEPSVNLSAHWAPIIQPSVLRPSANAETSGVAFGQFFPTSIPLSGDGPLTS